MKLKLTKKAKLIVALILTAQVICLCCVFSACARAQAESSNSDHERAVIVEPVKFSDPRLPADRYSVGVMTCVRWLRDMMTELGITDGAMAPYDYAAVFTAAYEAGLTDTVEMNPYAVLTRSYVADTVVRALGYSPHAGAYAADLNEDDAAMTTLVYYGWFIPDDSDMVYPGDAVTDREYEGLMAELRTYKALSGKRLLSFGDSIMYGMGNGGEGISDMIAGKYGMTAADYSVSGATFGVYDDRSHIPDQVRQAINEQKTADVILINGGTNDAVLCSQGAMSAGFLPGMFDEDTFSGGMETSLALIGQYWRGVPLIYVRAHDMALCADAVERLFGEHAVTIADKWSVSVADVYSDTAFNAADELIRNKYTYYNEQRGRADSIHPTALGYAKYYLPLITEKLTAAIPGESE